MLSFGGLNIFGVLSSFVPAVLLEKELICLSGVDLCYSSSWRWINSIVLFYSFAVRNAVISELGCLYQTLPFLMSV